MPDTQILVLVIAAMVAGIVCFRLYMILGRKTGREPALRAPLPVRPAAEGPRPAPDAPPSSSGLLDIQQADRSFDVPHFLTGAREAYGEIVTAFARGDRDALRPLLSPDVMAAFEGEIAARGAVQPPAFTRLADARIVGAALEQRTAEITVAFTAEFAAAAGPQTVTDVWTFARNLDSADPNWSLVATSGDLPG